MRIWLVTIGEPLPVDGKDVRLYRAGILAQMLAGRGHNVTWWTSSFDHTHKRQRVEKNTTLSLDEFMQIKLMYAPGYARNVSIQRIWNHRRLARGFRSLASKEAKPDVIIASYPTIELSKQAVAYGMRHQVPVIVDVRDLWPDLFLDLLPDYIRSVGKIACWPMVRNARYVFAHATAVTGLTDQYVEWALDYAKRQRGKFDRVFPMAYPEANFTREALDAAKREWRSLGVDEKNWNICFFGTFGRQFDIYTVIEAARLLKDQNPEVRFVLCGDGDYAQKFKDAARGIDSVLFPDWVNQVQIRVLMEISRAGLAPYVNTANFINNLPNKPIEYLSGGLPILTCLRGVLKDLIEQQQCGKYYLEGSAQSLADAVVDLANNEGERAKMAENALGLYREKYSAEVVYGSMCEFLERMAGNPDGPHQEV